MLEREKDAKPNNYTAKWRAMREVGKAVATGFFFFNVLYWADVYSLVCGCTCFPLFYL